MAFVTVGAGTTLGHSDKPPRVFGTVPWANYVSVHVSVCACLRLCVYVCVCIYVSVCVGCVSELMSVYVCVYMCVHVCVCVDEKPNVFLYHLSIYQSICLSIYLCICLFVYYFLIPELVCH